MDRSLIKSMMPSLVAGHVPRNVRSFKYRVFDDQPLSSTLGFAIDPQPFDGKVVAATDDAIVVKLKPSEFAVLDPSLVTTVPAEGAKVHVQSTLVHIGLIKIDGTQVYPTSQAQPEAPPAEDASASEADDAIDTATEPAEREPEAQVEEQEPALAASF